MKQFITLIAVLLFVFTCAAQQQLDHINADTLIVIKQPDGNNIVVAGKIWRDVPDSLAFFARQERLKARLNAVSQIEQQLVAQKEQLKLDSINLEKERLAYEEDGGKQEDLFKEKLQSLVGVWNLKVNAATDQITIEEDGSFTSNKSGSGTIKLEAVDKMIVSLGANKLRLYEKGKEWFSQDAKIHLYR